MVTFGEFFFIRVVFYFVIHSGMQAAYKRLSIRQANQSWMDVNFFKPKSMNGIMTRRYRIWYLFEYCF